MKAGTAVEPSKTYRVGLEEVEHKECNQTLKRAEARYHLIRVRSGFTPLRGDLQRRGEVRPGGDRVNILTYSCLAAGNPVHRGGEEQGQSLYVAEGQRYKDGQAGDHNLT